jgi:hypothetical protein
MVGYQSKARYIGIWASILNGSDEKELNSNSISEKCLS